MDDRQKHQRRPSGRRFFFGVQDARSSHRRRVASQRGAKTSQHSFSPGLLGRLWRPSVARSAWSESRTGRIATTLIARAATSFVAGRNAPGRLAARVARFAVVRMVPGNRRVVPAQQRTRHAPVSCWPAFFHHDARRWRRRQVMIMPAAAAGVVYWYSAPKITLTMMAPTAAGAANRMRKRQIP